MVKVYERRLNSKVVELGMGQKVTFKLLLQIC